jgi:hypothetical protein
VKKVVGTLVLKAFREAYLRRPASLAVCRKAQGILHYCLNDVDALVPPEGTYSRTGQEVHDRQISDLLTKNGSSSFRLADGAVNFILDLLNSEKPRAVIEFGSGISTLWLSMVLERIHGSHGFKLLSIEQDELELKRTIQMLDAYARFSSTRVVQCPLVSGMAGSRPTVFYDLTRIPYDDIRWLGEIEFVLIDGPFGKGPCRYGTVKQIGQYVKPGARFAMDDALREKELFTGYLWSQEGFFIDGIHMVGEGVMTGNFPGPGSRTTV